MQLRQVSAPIANAFGVSNSITNSLVRQVSTKEDEKTRRQQAKGESGIKSKRAWWDPLGVFTGKGGGSRSSTVFNRSSTNVSATINTSYVVTDTGPSATDHTFIGQLQLNVDRTYKFDLSDSSNTNYPLKFSADATEGPNDATPGTEYTQGVSKVGTAGQAGAYTSIAIDENTSISMFAYADGTPAASTTGIGFGFLDRKSVV